MSRLHLMVVALRGWRTLLRGGLLTRFIAWYVSSQMVFDSAIWILFLQHRGFSLAEIGLAEAAFHLAPVLLEIPSGSFADLAGRRWSLAIGSGLSALAVLIVWNAHTLPMVMLALFISGANYSFRSGADQAYLYDALAEDRKAGFGKIFGRLLAVGYVLGGAATWLGAFLSEWSYAWPYALMGITSCCGVILAVGLPEAKRERAHEIRRSPRQHIANVRILLRAQPVVARMLVTAAAFWLTMTISGLYAQAAFRDRGLDNGQIGLLIGISWVMVAIGATLGAQVQAAFRTVWPWWATATSLCIALVATGPVILGIAMFLGREIFAGAIEPRFSAWYNDRLPSAQRATVISIESWLFSCLMTGIFPLAGWFADRTGWGPMYLVTGGVAAITAVVGWRLLTGDIRAAAVEGTV